MMLSEILEKHLREIQAQSAPAPKSGTVFAAPQVGANAPTDKQVNYFKALVEGKQINADQRKMLMDGLAALDRRSITSTIQWLVGLPWAPRPAVTTQTQGPRNPAVGSKIDQGYYAVNDPADGVLKFYQVRRPKEGKWAGYVFLSQVSGDNHIPLKDRALRNPIYAEIEKDVMGALRRFGKEIGQCGHCRKQLTDAESREFGIGPVCRKVLGV